MSKIKVKVFYFLYGNYAIADLISKKSTCLPISHIYPPFGDIFVDILLLDNYYREKTLLLPAHFTPDAVLDPAKGKKYWFIGERRKRGKGSPLRRIYDDITAGRNSLHSLQRIASLWA